MKIPSNIKRLLIITLISFLIIGAIIYFTADKRTWASVKTMNKYFILLGFVFYLLEFSFDALRLKVLVKATGHYLKIFECYKLVAFQTFFNLITPFSMGGQPGQIYILHKKNVPGGSATTVVITKLLLAALALVLVTIYAMLFYSDIFTSIPIFKYVAQFTGMLLLLITAFFIIAIYNPKLTTSILTKVFFVLWKLKLTKHPDELQGKLLKHILLARESFNSFIGHRVLYFLTGFLLSLGMVIVQIMMVLSFMWGLNVHLALMRGIALTGTLLFLITFMPTPGSSGLGEGIFILLFKSYVPSYLIGVIIFLWRFFYNYLTSFMGAIVTGHYGSELLTNKKIKDKK